MFVKYSDDIDPNSLALHHDVYPIYSSLPFTLYDCGCMTAYRNYFTKRSDFDMYLLFLTLEGCGILEYRDKTIEIHPNEIVLINCTEPHHYYTAQSGYWKFKWLHIKGVAIQDYFYLINGNTITNLESKEAAELTDQKFDSIFRIAQDESRKCDVLISNLISDILTSLVCHSNHQEESYQTSNSRSQDIRKVLDYIEENYTNNISINDLTKIACMSRYHFFRTFKNCTGKTPYEYMLSKKIQSAMSLLKTQSMTVTQVCQKVKYSNVNNFIKDFKKAVGMTPNRYRQNKGLSVLDEEEEEETVHTQTGSSPQLTVLNNENNISRTLKTSE